LLEPVREPESQRDATFENKYKQTTPANLAVLTTRVLTISYVMLQAMSLETSKMHVNTAPVSRAQSEPLLIDSNPKPDPELSSASENQRPLVRPVVIRAPLRASTPSGASG